MKVHISTSIMLNTQILVSSAAFLLCQVAGQYAVRDPHNQPAVPGGKLPATIDPLGCSGPGGLSLLVDPLRRCSTFVGGAYLPHYFDQLGCTRPGGLPIWQDPHRLCSTYLPGARYPIGIDSVGWSRPGYTGAYVAPSNGGLVGASLGGGSGGAYGTGLGNGGGAGYGGNMGSGLGSGGSMGSGGGMGSGGSMGSGLGSGGSMGSGLGSGGGSGGGMSVGLGGGGASFGGMGGGLGGGSGGGSSGGSAGGASGGSGGSGGNQNGNGGSSSSQVTYVNGSPAHLQHAVNDANKAGSDKHNTIITQSNDCSSETGQSLDRLNAKAKLAVGGRQDISLSITNEIQQGKLNINQHLTHASNNPDQWKTSYENAEKAAMHTLYQVNQHLIEAGVSESDRNQMITEARNEIMASFTNSRNEIYKYERYHTDRREYVREVAGYRMDVIRVETVNNFDKQVESLNSWTRETLSDNNRKIHVHNELVACRNEVQRCFMEYRFYPNQAEECANKAVDYHIPRVKVQYHEDGVSEERTNEIVDPHRNRMKQIIQNGKEEMEQGIQQAATAGVRWEVRRSE